MQKEKGEIQKRLESNRCPWCTHSLKLISEEYEGDQRILSRQCPQCSGKIVDHFTHEGDANGDDTRSQG